MRLDAPISVALVGQGSARYSAFLDQLLTQIGREASVAISRGGPPNGLTIQFVPGAEWGPLDGNQCVIVFGRPGWQTFLDDRVRYSDWRKVSADELAYRTVFIPDTNEPHEIRECLIEEVAQALGPTNDIYGLGPSIFNDDDAHVWPTRLDYLMLRVLYDPEMASGIGRREARVRAERILDRINPDGRGAPVLPAHRQKDFLSWRKQLHRLYDLINSGKAGSPKALMIVARILREAENRAPNSPYHCEALSVAATLESERPGGSALPAVDRARSVCERAHGKSDIRNAALRLSRAIALLAEKQDEATLREIQGLPDVFLAQGQEALLAITHAVRWTALYNLEDPQADAARVLAIAWSTYAFGENNAAVQRWRNL